MKFEDLEFKQPHDGFGIQARHDFKNKYGVSVIQSPYSFTSNDDEYEVAVMYNGSLCYSTHITNDVLGHQTKEDINKILKQVEELNE